MTLLGKTFSKYAMKNSGQAAAAATPQGTRH
jgi:hypothetical protein